MEKSKMKHINLDLETYSDVDLQKCGLYKYAQSPNFEILLFGYAVDGGEVEVVDLSCGEEIPQKIIEALTDDSVTKWAFNASFERICLSVWLRRNYPENFSSYSIDEDSVGDYLDPSAWKCSMIWSAYMGLPLSLAGVGAVLGLEEQKLKEGKDLIRYFCIPCKPTKVNGGRTRNHTEHDLEKWNRFKFYNKRDVEVEISIQEKLKKYPVPDFVWEEYHLDQEINDRGIALDMAVVKNAIDFDAKSKSELSRKIQELTSLGNPNSVMQMKKWLADNGLDMDSLGKKEVAQAVKTAPKELADVLRLRQQLAKSSVKKYQSMQNAVCEDARARGMFQFYGGNRTGRYSGRLIQLQNLRQNHMPDLEQARGLVESGNYNAMELLYDDIPDTLSQLIRTAFVPRDGMKFIVADFSAIEARALSWLAGERWRMDVFEKNGDIYCETASKMFHCKVVKHGENSELRQKGKQCELSCGYGGSVGALKAMGALESGMQEDELKPLVDAWRQANPNIVCFWWAVDRAAKKCIKQKTTTETHGIYFSYQSGFLFITLPSGRKLAYVKPRIGENRFGGESVTYEGVGGTKKWERIESYGPKFVENIVQAISRDILCFAMETLRNYFIVAHVHDEVIIEADMRMSLSAVCEQMARTPPWAKGLLLRADGYECQFYQKD
jgi:DNA polymerase